MAPQGLRWPSTAEELEGVQRSLAAQQVESWSMPPGEVAIGGCFVSFPRGISGPGAPGDPAWAVAVVMRGARVAQSVAAGSAGAGYEPGMLALREGPLLEAVVRGLSELPDVLLVNATGRDHQRRCGLAMHLGAVLAIPTVGVTHRPLQASGAWPPDEAVATSPLLLDGDIAGYWLRSKVGARPLAVHAGWRTTPEVAVEVVRRSLLGARTPAPLRRAREIARLARQSSSRLG